LSNALFVLASTMESFAAHTPKSAQEALDIQQEMRRHVSIKDDFSRVKTIAGIDVGYDIAKNVSKAALVVMNIDELVPIISIVDFDPTPFPYIPGLLSFREAPVILKALSQLKETPEMLFVDGHGIAHPRRLGIAAHIGVLTGIPSIGVAKSVLCGHYKEPGIIKGNAEPLLHKGEKIAIAYRSRDKVKPIFISPGHKVSHESAVELVAKCLTRFRLPEPTRIADKLSKIQK
jgi:deoxyribonuclease V